MISLIKYEKIIYFLLEIVAEDNTTDIVPNIVVTSSASFFDISIGKVLVNDGFLIEKIDILIVAPPLNSGVMVI